MENANPWSAYLDRIREAHAPGTLDALEHELFGRREGTMTLAMKALKDLDAEGKKQYAQDLNAWKKKLTEALASQRNTLSHPSDDVLARNDAIDVTLSLPQQDRGVLHLIPSFMEHAADVFGRMGFDVATGPEVESEDMNFDMLNIPPGPSRTGRAGYILGAGQGQTRSADAHITRANPIHARAQAAAANDLHGQGVP